MENPIKTFNFELKDLIQEFDEALFFSTYWSRKPLYLEGSAKSIKSIFGWRQFNKALTEHRLSYPRIRIMNESGLVDPDTYTLNLETIKNQPTATFLNLPVVNELLASNSTLIYNAIEEVEHDLRKVCHLLSGKFLCYVSANAYTSFGSEGGFKKHWDDHEVIAIQVEGEKRWKIYEPVRKYPLDNDVTGNIIPSMDLILDVTLKEGDFLYIPRGFWHEVLPVNKPTLHLSFAIQPPIGKHWAEWIVEKSLVHQVLRENIPLFGSSSEIEDYAERVRLCLISLLQKENIYDYLEYRKGRTKPHPYFSLPHSITRNTLVPDTYIAFSSFSHYKLDDHDNPDIFIVGALDKEWRFDKSVEIIIDNLLESKYCKIEDLLCLTNLPSETIKNFIYELLNNGLIEVL